MRVIKRNWGRRGGTDIVLAKTQAPNEVGDLAIKIADHFSVIAATPDGEDSAGRSKLRLATPDEVAKRACDLAESLWAEMTGRGMILDVPAPEPPMPADDENGPK